MLNILLGMTGFFGAGQMFYWIGEKITENKRLAPHFFGELILSATEFMMTLALVVFFAILLKVGWNTVTQSRKKDPDRPS